MPSSQSWSLQGWFSPSKIHMNHVVQTSSQRKGRLTGAKVHRNSCRGTKIFETKVNDHRKASCATSCTTSSVCQSFWRVRPGKIHIRPSQTPFPQHWHPLDSPTSLHPRLKTSGKPERSGPKRPALTAAVWHKGSKELRGDAVAHMPQAKGRDVLNHAKQIFQQPQKGAFLVSLSWCY